MEPLLVFAVAATAAADRSSAVVAAAAVKRIDPECCCGSMEDRSIDDCRYCRFAAAVAVSLPTD